MCVTLGALSCLGVSVCILWRMPYLALLHWGCVFVTHWADLHPPLPLSVPLVEELIHYPISPLTVQFQGLGGVTQVSTVHHVPQHLERIQIEQNIIRENFTLHKSWCNLLSLLKIWAGQQSAVGHLTLSNWFQQKSQQSNKVRIWERALQSTKKMDGVRKGVTVGAEVIYVGGRLMTTGCTPTPTNYTGYWFEPLKVGKREVQCSQPNSHLLLDYLFLDTYLYSVGVIVQQQHSRARHLLGFHHGLQISQQTHVFGHVCSQNLDRK